MALHHDAPLAPAKGVEHHGAERHHRPVGHEHPERVRQGRRPLHLPHPRDGHRRPGLGHRLRSGETRVLAQRADWERFDGIVWTPWGTVLAAEEVITAAVRDPAVPEATAGLVYEFFIDPTNPGQLKTDDPRDDVAPFDDGVAVRPALGSKSHEGLRFDKRGNHYGISESNPGAIYRFVPDHKGDLSDGTLQALRTANGHDGEGSWVDLPDEEARTNAQAAAAALGANGYNRPEDVETGQSTGVDRNNGDNTLYVAITGTDEILAIDLSRSRRPFA
jgi:uncharacterized protein